MQAPALPSKQLRDASSTRSGETTGKKRKRPPIDQQQQHGIDLPRIPGIPIEILPLHVQALKLCSIFIRRHADKEVILPYPLEMNNVGDGLSELDGRTTKNCQRDTAVSSVMDKLFYRIERGTEQAEAQTDAGRDRRECMQRMDQAVSSWLQVIHQWLRDNSNRHGRSEEQKGSTNNILSCAVPVAVLEHLLKVAVEHHKLNVKRSATHMAGYLLHKSSDCRRWFFEEAETSMITWMDAVSSCKAEPTGAHLWQRESYLLLHHLNFDFGHLYPTLSVALQRFQQICLAPCATESVQDGSLVISMVERRRVRNEAMTHGATEERRVRKLIERAHICTDVLVPRLTDGVVGKTAVGDTKPSSIFVEENRALDVLIENEDDDENVEWEDGWENEESGEAPEDDEPARHKSTNVSHAVAVEQTLAVMKSAGGLQGGQLEIDFAQRETPHKIGTHLEALGLARLRLQKVVRILENRYMPRLSSWVDCLTQADSLVEVSGEQQKAAVGGAIEPTLALVSMPPSQIEQRNEILRRMLDLKREAATVISSSKRLGLEREESVTGTTISGVASHPRPVATVNLSFGLQIQNQNQSLEVNLSRRRPAATAPRDVTHKRSNRIQIKYRKD